MSQILEIVTNANALTIVSIIVGILAVVVTVAIAFAQRTKKTLTYNALTHFPIVNAGPMSSVITISVDGQPLANPHMLAFAMRHTGNRAIRSDDFDRPMFLSFAEARIVTLSSDGPPITAAPTQAGDGRAVIEISPFLLNPGEGFVLTALLDGCPHEFQVDARIADTSVRDGSSPSFAASLLSAVVLPAGSGNIPTLIIGRLLGTDDAPSIPTHHRRQ